MITPSLPDLEFLKTEPLLNRERAAAVMAAEGLDGIVVAFAPNVFYATNFYPLVDRMTLQPSSCAVIPRDPKRPVTYVVPSFTYYYIESDEGVVPGVKPLLFTSFAGYRDSTRTDAEAQADDPMMFRIVDPTQLTAKERRRRADVEAAAPYAANMQWGLARALRELGLDKGRLGYDDPVAHEVGVLAAPGATWARADDTLRRIRLVRSPAEIRLMRIAAQNNVDAGMAAMRDARRLGSLRALRQRFFAEAALRGNTGVFMVVDQTSSDLYDEKLYEGQSLLIDCVSQCRNYHGDFGRSLWIGEPPKRVQYCVEAMSKGWEEIRRQMKRGMTFSRVREIGLETVKKLGYDVTILFNAHSVGICHTDQPRSAPGGGPVDHVIEENMILSIDVALFETGDGGSAHLEDLTLITANGCEVIHESPPAAVVI